MRWRLRGLTAAARSAAAGEADPADPGEPGAEAHSELAGWRRMPSLELTIAPRPVLVGGSLLRAPDVSGTRSLLQRPGAHPSAGDGGPGNGGPGGGGHSGGGPGGRVGGIVVPQLRPEPVAPSDGSRRGHDRAARGSRQAGRRAESWRDGDRPQAGELPAGLAPVKRRSAGQPTAGERLNLVTAAGEFVGDPRAEETPYSSSAWLRMVQAYRQLPDDGADDATQILPGLTQSVSEDGSTVMSWSRPTAAAPPHAAQPPGRAVPAEPSGLQRKKASLAESRRLGLGRPLPRGGEPPQFQGEADDSAEALAALPLPVMPPGMEAAELGLPGTSSAGTPEPDAGAAIPGAGIPGSGTHGGGTAREGTPGAESPGTPGAVRPRAQTHAAQAQAATFAVARARRLVPPGLGLGAPITLRGVPGSPGNSRQELGSGASPAGRPGTGAGPGSPRRPQGSPHDPFSAVGFSQAAGPATSPSSGPQRPVARTTRPASEDEAATTAHRDQGPAGAAGPELVVVTPIYRVAAELPHVRVPPPAFGPTVEPLVHREPAAPEPATEAAARATAPPPVVPGPPADYSVPAIGELPRWRAVPGASWRAGVRGDDCAAAPLPAVRSRRFRPVGRAGEPGVAG